MNIDDFDIVYERVRARYAWMESEQDDVAIFNNWIASEGDLARVEDSLEILLPVQYKAFMLRYGGGQFLFVDILPVVSPDGRVESLLEVNDRRNANFLKVAPVGTGDWWGFRVADNRCEDRIGVLDHEVGTIGVGNYEFFDFVARYGLQADLGS